MRVIHRKYNQNIVLKANEYVLLIGDNEWKFSSGFHQTDLYDINGNKILREDVNDYDTLFKMYNVIILHNSRNRQWSIVCQWIVS
jgi:hypothetical protein